MGCPCCAGWSGAQSRLAAYLDLPTDSQNQFWTSSGSCNGFLLIAAPSSEPVQKNPSSAFQTASMNSSACLARVVHRLSPVSRASSRKKP